MWCSITLCIMKQSLLGPDYKTFLYGSTVIHRAVGISAPVCWYLEENTYKNIFKGSVAIYQQKE